MNDQPQTIPADLTRDEARAVREWALNALNKPGASTTAEKAVARVVIGTVPDPRPTLADMTPEEQDACQWMQADLNGYGSRVVILNPGWMNDSARVMWTHTRIGAVSQRSVTPRPDLPRLTWPAGDKKAAPTPALPDGWRLADHKDHGRVIVTNPTPNSDGPVCYVLPADWDGLGFDWQYCDPDELTYIDPEPEEA